MTMISEATLEHPLALTSDERALFRTLGWRLWVIGLGLCLLGTVTGCRAYSVFAVQWATDRYETKPSPDRNEDNTLLIAVIALVYAAPTLRAAWKATRATRLQIDARQAMFALLIEFNAALKWLSYFMFIFVFVAIVCVGLLIVVGLTA